MSYEILIGEEGLSILHITEATFNSLKGWRVQFHDGKDAMLFNQSNRWLQYNSEWLDTPTIMAIGKCIETSIKKKNTGIADSYFYDMLVN